MCFPKRSPFSVPSRWGLLFLFAVVFAILAHQTDAVQANNAISNLPAPSEYVGSQACAACHRSLYESYRQTSMGRSMSLVTPALLKKLHLPANFDDLRQHRSYQVYSKDGELFQSEFETAETGAAAFRSTHQIKWMVGSGENIFGGIVQREGYLFEAPLAFYSKPATWGLAPGYEFADYGFSRPILPGCIVCHSGRSEPVPGTNGQYESLPFAELEIGCEKCHGPGAAHIQAMHTGAQAAANPAAIVNPARLTPELANNICMGCHEIGDERVLKPGRSYEDIRPGAPLDDTFSIFMVPPTREAPPQKDHLQHYYSMTLSKCYRASEGKLACITCHDPHVEPTPEQAPAVYNSKCLRCHSDQSCRLPIATRRQSGAPPDNCIACHMQKRDVGFILHTSLTNHRITIHPDEPFPESTFHQTTPSLPDLIQLNPAPGQTKVPPPLLTLLQAYGELAADKPQYVAPYLEVLDRLRNVKPDNPLVLGALGSRDLKDGRFSQAVEHLQRALQIGPPQATLHAALAQALLKLGHPDAALAEQQKAVALDPFNPLLQKTLVLLLIQGKDYASARLALEHYLVIFPQDSFMRKMLVLAQGGAEAK